MAANSVFGSSIVPEVLNDENYKMWRSCMKDYLLGQDLWDVTTEAEEETNESSKKIWRKKNALALHAIKMTCNPEFLALITEVELAKEAWDLFKSKLENPESETKPEEKEDDAKLALIQEYDPFIKATKDMDWNTMKLFIDSHPEALGAQVFEDNCTALHFLLFDGKEEAAKLLVDQMTADDLGLQDDDDCTALAILANNFPTHLQFMEQMVSRNENLPNIGGDKRTPLVVASWKGYKDVTRFLYSVTDKKILNPEHGKLGVKVLVNCINIKLFDIASEIVKTFPKLLLERDHIDTYPIYALAKSFSTFTNGSRHKESSRFSMWMSHFGAYLNLHHLLGGENMLEVSNDKKTIYIQARTFLQLVCDQVSTYDTNLLKEAVYGAMIEATKNGTVEFIKEMLRANPNLIHAYDDHKMMFCYAVEYRHEKVFDLIYGVYDKKDKLLSSVNADKNNILHLAATIAHSSILDRKSGPALQMQRELQWFEEVWKVAKPRYREDLNKNNLTPSQLFTKNHENLREAGERAMKDTAQSATTVGALIVTIMFAAAFTVPGGNNQDTGLPLFLRNVLLHFHYFCASVFRNSHITLCRKRFSPQATQEINDWSLCPFFLYNKYDGSLLCSPIHYA